ncbi:MAG: thiamine-phosphate kinase [Planctomycetota bacterium]
MDPEHVDIAALRALLGGDGLAGPGDDAAVVELGGDWALTTDPVVEGVHFEAGTAPARVANKLLQRNLSDLAAMGAEPAFVLCSFCFGPGWDRDRRQALYEALERGCAEAGVRWVGGDLAGGAATTCLTITALGRVGRGGAVRRSGLVAGDRLCVTGPLGGSLRSGRHLDFRARVAEGRWLAERFRPHAMIDVSDGLALDLARMLEASGGLGATLDAAAIPVHPDAGPDPLAAALGDGEDFELLFGVAPADLEALAADPLLGPAGRRPIGTVDAEPGLRLRHPDGRVVPLDPGGFEHALP